MRDQATAQKFIELRAHRPTCRTHHRLAVRLRRELGYWGRRPRPSGRLLFLVHRILKHIGPEFGENQGTAA